MEILRDKARMRAWSHQQHRHGHRIGFVPTMGYLHQGHLSLVREAQRLTDCVVVSIYVNPTQCAPHEDFAVYPRDEAGDLAKLSALGVDAVFVPAELHDTPGRQQAWVELPELAKPLCGKSRPHFFRGVATVVTKLCHLVEPDVAVFGKKDYQQWRVLETMARELDFAVRIVGQPIVREPDGLAMSSRNARLDAASASKRSPSTTASSGWRPRSGRGSAIPLRSRGASRSGSPRRAARSTRSSWWTPPRSGPSNGWTCRRCWPSPRILAGFA